MSSVLDLQKVTQETDEQSHVMGATWTITTTITLSTLSTRC